MGAYLSKPVTDKEIEFVSNDNMSYACGSMQGWRISQEDAHNAIPNFYNKMSLFAVYDGHGGAEVAQLCTQYLPDHIKNHKEFINGNISDALKHSFLEFDEGIISKENQAILKKLATVDDGQSENSSGVEDDDPSLLNEEARKPLEEVLGQYYKEENNYGDEKIEANSSEDTAAAKANKRRFIQKVTGLFENFDTKKMLSDLESESSDSDVYVAEDEEEDEDEDDDEDEEGESEDNNEENEDEDCEDEENEEDGEDESNEAIIPFNDMDMTPGYNSGSTAVVALIDMESKMIYVANAGDSRCVLCRSGKAVEMSIDHKPEDKLETERITNAGGILTEDGRVNGGLNLSRSIGDHFYKQNEDFELKDQMISALPDVKSIDFRQDEDEFMVLACDGIWNSMTSEEVVQFIRQRIEKTDLESIVSELFNSCLASNTAGDGTGCDNMTCIIVDFKHKVKKTCNGESKQQQELLEATATTTVGTKRKAEESADHNGDNNNNNNNSSTTTNHTTTTTNSESSSSSSCNSAKIRKVVNNDDSST